MQTAVGVFGGEAYVDGIDAPPLMVANAGKSSHPAISSLNCSPFIAVELCREHLVCDSICLFSCRSLFVSLVCGSDKMHNPMHRTHVIVVIKLWNLSHEEFCETSHIGRSTTDIVEETVFDSQAFELGTSGCSCLKDVLAKIIQFLIQVVIGSSFSSVFNYLRMILGCDIFSLYSLPMLESRTHQSMCFCL